MKKKDDSKAKRSITRILKMEGGQTAKVLAERLEMTPMGARQHLYALKDEKLIDFKTEKPSFGRPSKVWYLCEEANILFPDAHAELSVSLLASIRAPFGEEGVKKIFQSRIDQQLALYQEELETCTSLSEKVELLSQLRTKEGYMAEWLEEDGFYYLSENHRPVCAAATFCQGLCQMELEMFSQCLGKDAKIERTEHILDGKRRCAYKISTK